ncbi:MAG: NUDIX domain-containing protein [Bacteroidales bacterium]|nr:NUDIX domain-containing protein [Bacteroidales bacterium]MDT8431211.1 NUDIX domain-containing protein [Bacteroidales bacterium]
MQKEVEISLLPAGSVKASDLTYVVIGAREAGKWIFVRHEERDTWELPAGHIEPGEDPDHAAQRELFEETGTTGSDLRHLHDYVVRINGVADYGRLYFARVNERRPLPDSEIGEILLDTTTPGPATYPEAHAVFIDVLRKVTKKK